MTHYRETQSRSAELLRMSLVRMAEHPAAYNPITYAVWYEHLGGINPALSRAIDKRVEGGLKLDDEFVQQLYRTHVAELDAEQAERVSGDFRRVMQTLSETAARTGGSANELGERLGALHEALESPDPTTRARKVNEALASASQLRGSLDSLQQQVASSRGEIEALREELQRTRAEAVLCPLTRVLNRKGFDERLQELLNAEGGAPSFALVMIDIDHFKQINDEHGHLIGDRVLEALGEVLRRLLANKGASVARYGGEEFGVLLPGRGRAAALLVAEQLREAVKLMRIRQRATDKIVLKVTISAGVAVARADDDAASLVDRADSALYQSKHEGRDRVTAAD